MLVAKVENLNIVSVLDYREMFPTTTWANGVPSNEWIIQNGCLPVSVFKAHDRNTQRLVQSEPYIEDGTVFTVTIEDKTPEEIQAENQVALSKLKQGIISSTQSRLDSFVRTRGYDDANSTSKYKDISDEEIQSLPLQQQQLVTKFRAECRYVGIATASTWAKLYLILGEVESGIRPIPSSYADIEPELPPLEWPL